MEGFLGLFRQVTSVMKPFQRVESSGRRCTWEMPKSQRSPPFGRMTRNSSRHSPGVRAAAAMPRRRRLRSRGWMRGKAARGSGREVGRFQFEYPPGGVAHVGGDDFAAWGHAGLVKQAGQHGRCCGRTRDLPAA